MERFCDKKTFLFRTPDNARYLVFASTKHDACDVLNRTLGTNTVTEITMAIKTTFTSKSDLVYKIEKEEIV